ncbi:hypothetical protein GCM10022381_22550 [Leifsonia kafniensis]|uniref:DNRLRE domain-containing protein n=1 Tax=Leifsonia kafniensis TaxID=475957 RepID=A0ABP7KJA5_9MICO
MRLARTLSAVGVGAMIVVMIGVPPAFAADTQVAVVDVADTYTAASAPSADYGTSGSLGVYGTPAIVTVVRFVIPAAPAGQSLSSAVLRLTTTSLATAGSVNAVTVRQATDSWSETGTVYANRPVVSGAVLGTLPGGTVPSTVYDIGLAALAGTSGSVTLALEGTGADSSWFWSRQVAASLRPVLNLTFTGGIPVDTTAPSVPVGLAATVVGDTVGLDWQASTDDVGVAGYAVHRSASAVFTPDLSNRIATVTGLAYSDVARPVGTWYYRVTASDAAANTSAGSTPAPATVAALPDTTPPSVPTGLVATVTGSTIGLTWQASTDGVGVVSYAVHRSASSGFIPGPSTKVADVAGLTYSDPGRPAGSWFYRVTASDAAGNTSAGSTQAAGTVQVASPPTQVAVVAVADTYTAASAPTVDYGTSGSLAVYGTPAIVTVVRFVIPPAPAGQSLSSAVLRLTTTSLATSGSANAVTVRQATDSWSETGTVYSNRPAVSGAVLGTLAGGTVPSTVYDIGLTAAALAGTSGSVTLALEGTGSDSSWFWSRQVAASLRPVLNLTFTGGIPPDTGTVTVMAVGDIACQSGTPVTSTTCRHGDVASLIAAAAPDRFIALGDLQYQQSTLAQFLAPGAYNDTFGAVRGITLPVLGNHEYLDGTNGYFDYFYGAGVNSGAFGPRPDGYYATSIGSWTFIALNTECTAGGVTGGCGVGSAEYVWLQNQLASSTQCTIVAAHHPRWSTGTSHGSYPQMSALWDLMATNGVDVVLSGHNHVSEIFTPIGASGAGATPTLSATGIRSFTAGDGGANLQALSANSDPLLSAVEARSASAFGPLKLTLGAGSYSWQFLPVSGMTFTNAGTTGSFTGTDSCH